MSTLSLFDFVLSHDRPDPLLPAEDSRIPRWAAQLVDEALTEIAHIQAMDLDLGAGTAKAGFSRQVAELLRGTYEDWGRRTEALLVRVTNVEKRGTRVDGAERLRDEHGRVAAMLQVTLAALDEAADQARRGEVFSLEEVRSELRTRNRA